ncbi:MAG: hypothetical protein RLZZ265_1971 [Verrucomicrobiota bacterium]
MLKSSPDGGELPFSVCLGRGKLRLQLLAQIRFGDEVVPGLLQFGCLISKLSLTIGRGLPKVAFALFEAGQGGRGFGKAAFQFGLGLPERRLGLLPTGGLGVELLAQFGELLFELGQLLLSAGAALLGGGGDFQPGRLGALDCSPDPGGGGVLCFEVCGGLSEAAFQLDARLGGSFRLLAGLGEGGGGFSQPPLQLGF